MSANDRTDTNRRGIRYDTRQEEPSFYKDIKIITKSFFFLIMENYFRVVEIGELTERQWKPENGQERTIAGVEVTLTDGLDSFVAEANDDMARNLVKQKEDNTFNFDGLYRVRVRMKVTASKDKGLKFNNLRITDMAQL